MGQSSPRQIKSVILTARTARGPIALIVFEDGCYGITRNQRPLPEHRWEAAQLDDCIETFMNLSNDGRDPRGNP